MKKFLASLCIWLMLFNQVAFATTFHVRPEGDDGQTGLSWFQAYRTIAKANREARPGDIIYIYNGVNNTVALYNDAPNPDSAASNPSGYITYIGGSLNGDPLTDSLLREKIQIPGISINKEKYTVKGLRINGTANFGSSALSCSLVSNRVTGDFAMAAAKSNIVLSNAFHGKKVSLGNSLLTDSMYNNTVKNNIFPDLGTSGTGDTYHVINFGQGSLGRAITQNTFENNKFNVWVTGIDQAGLAMFYTTANTFKDNRYDIRYDSPTYDRIIKLRNRTAFNSFLRDTFVAWGSRPAKFFLSQQGGGDDTTGSNIGMVLDSCIFYNYTGADCAIFDTGINATIIKWCTFVGRGKALGIKNNVYRTNKFDHNTFVGDGSGGVINWWDSNLWRNQDIVDSLVFTNNIVYSLDPEVVEPCNANGYWGDATCINWGGIQNLSGKIKANWNLYYSKPHKTIASLGDKQIYYDNNGINCSGVGNGSAWETALPSQDSLSTYGSPVFLTGDSTVINQAGYFFDNRLHELSNARGRGKSASDVGAKAFTEVGQAELTFFRNAVLVFSDTASSYSQVATIHNTGTDTLDIAFTLPDDISISPTTSSVLADSLQDFTVTWNRTNTTPRTVNILINNNTPGNMTIPWFVCIKCNETSGSGPSGEIPSGDEGPSP